jgi:ABC-2 type transport system permease protein
MMNAAELLEQARASSGLTQEELARRAGTSRPTLSAYEHGRKSPTVATFARLLSGAGWELAALPQVSFTQRPSARGRPAWVPDRLPRLDVARALAVVELPLHLNWSAPGRVFDLRSRADRARVYEIVLQKDGPPTSSPTSTAPCSPTCGMSWSSRGQSGPRGRRWWRRPAGRRDGGGRRPARAAALPAGGGPDVLRAAGFLLVVAVALFCGDTVASEASWSSLRYLLAAPVPRARLLRQKLTVALGYSLAAVVVFPAMSLAAGTALYGWHPLRLPGSLVDLPPGTALVRLGIALAYVLSTLLFVAGLAFLLSVSTDSPLGAVGGAVGLAIISSILDAVTALGRFREILPTHWQCSWLSALQPQMSWDPMIEGAVVSASYAVVLLALAFRHFRHKDIVS